MKKQKTVLSFAHKKSEATKRTKHFFGSLSLDLQSSGTNRYGMHMVLRACLRTFQKCRSAYHVKRRPTQLEFQAG